MEKVLAFITNNQVVLITVLLCGTWILNKIVNRMAKRPEEDVWDKIKPWSETAYTLVFKGVEFLAQTVKMTSAQKSIEYINKLREFADSCGTDKAAAVAQLFAWYQAKKEKALKINPTVTEQLTSDTVATE